MCIKKCNATKSLGTFKDLSKLETFLKWCQLSSQEKMGDLSFLMSGLLYMKEIEFGVQTKPLAKENSKPNATKHLEKK